MCFSSILIFTVGKECELRINEINDANSNYQKQDNILCEKMLILKNEEEKYSALRVQDEELDRNITEEELNLKEVMIFFFQFLCLPIRISYVKSRVQCVYEICEKLIASGRYIEFTTTILSLFGGV